MDTAAIKLEFGDKLAMWGTVGTSRLWDWGTPNQIRAEVRHDRLCLGSLEKRKNAAHVCNQWEIKNSSACLVPCGGVKVILNKELLTKGYNLSELIKGVRIPVKLYLCEKGVLINARVLEMKKTVKRYADRLSITR